MNDPHAMETDEYRRVVRVIAEYDALLERTGLILGHRMAHTRLGITITGHVFVTWPELSGGYYDSYEIETQQTTIEPTMFVKSTEEIEAIKQAETEERERVDRDKQRRHYALQKRMDENCERAEYERLRAKYEGGG